MNNNYKLLKVGIVGFGGAGMANCKHFQAIKGCQVTAVYDPKEEGLNRARQVSGDFLLTDDFEYFLKSDIDIVMICSPDRTHAEYMVQSLLAGKHTITEKPLTDSVQGYKNIIQAMQASPHCVAAVQHQMRFLPVHIKMKEILQRGELGAISYIEGYYVHNLLERAGRYDDWRFTDNATPLVYSGCHFVDLLRWLLNDEVTEVMGMANNFAFPEYPESDLNVNLLRFRSGIVGKVVTAFGAGRPQEHSVRVFGREKSIENNLLFAKDGSYDIFHRPTLQHKIGDAEKLGGNKKRLMSVIFSHAFDKMAGFYRRSQHQDYSISSYPIRLYEHGYAVRASIVNFVEAIRYNKQLGAGVIDAAKTVAVCLAGVEAYRTGKTISLDDYWIPEFDTMFDDTAGANRRAITHDSTLKKQAVV